MAQKSSLPHGEPDWVEIPAGEFWMGSEAGDDRVRPVHRLHLDSFLMARVPVTNAQYRLFVEATGHRLPGHWQNGHPPSGLGNHPVVSVSRHDALAYCRWLSGVTGRSVTLPSEAEWEKAARGDRDKREYPWGEWVEGRCNTSEAGIGTTTPVGSFPEGVSPYGCLDMAGNVWEWTRSLWGRNWRFPEFEYPYRPEDGRENQGAGDDVLRVVRGGSFLCNHGFARCAFRNWSLPNCDWLTDVGFRVCVSPISPDPGL